MAHTRQQSRWMLSGVWRLKSATPLMCYRWSFSPTGGWDPYNKHKDADSGECQRRISLPSSGLDDMQHRLPSRDFGSALGAIRKMLNRTPSVYDTIHEEKRTAARRGQSTPDMAGCI